MVEKLKDEILWWFLGIKESWNNKTLNGILMLLTTITGLIILLWSSISYAKKVEHPNKIIINGPKIR